MVSFASKHILCLALMVSNMIIGALSGHTGLHTRTHAPSSHHTRVGDHSRPSTLSGKEHHQGTYARETDGTTYDVTTYGAVGDGEHDDSTAFISAWNAACKSKSDNAKVTVPGGKTFLVSPVDFEGPCNSRGITFEVQGTIVAPPKSKWKNQKADKWLNFHNVVGLTVDGIEQGLVDGQGATWWGSAGETGRPTALSFTHCSNLRVTGLKHKNSQRSHVSISGCSSVVLSRLHITAPATSPNTDGIDISNSKNIRILDSDMGTGDDCIAINGGTSYVNISNINCGPGHGISIGSLGKDGQSDQVESVYVTKCTFNRTQNGVRIKTWQGGSGYARHITFSEITFVNADNPVLIDQYYCPHKECDNDKSAVEISDVRYTGLHGTSISKNSTITLRCSQSVPCTSIIMNDVNIKPLATSPNNTAHCINAHGSCDDCIHPAVDCLKK